MFPTFDFFFIFRKSILMIALYLSMSFGAYKSHFGGLRMMGHNLMKGTFNHLPCLVVYNVILKVILVRWIFIM